MQKTVKITGGSEDQHWYGDLVGQEFVVWDEGQGIFILDDIQTKEKQEWRKILLEHCEEVV